MRNVSTDASLKGSQMCMQPRWECLQNWPVAFPLTKTFLLLVSSYGAERTRWHFTKTSLRGVFVLSSKGPPGWLRDETRRGHFFLIPCPQASLPHVRTLSVLIKLLMNTHMHNDTHTSLPVQSYDRPKWPYCSVAAGQWVSLLSQPHCPVCFVSQDECLSADLQCLIIGLSCPSDPPPCLAIHFFCLSASFYFSPPWSVTEIDSHRHLMLELTIHFCKLTKWKTCQQEKWAINSLIHTT